MKRIPKSLVGFIVVGGVCVFLIIYGLRVYNRRNIVDTLYRPKLKNQFKHPFNVKVKLDKYYYVVFSDDSFATEQVITKASESSGEDKKTALQYEPQKFLHEKEALEFSKQFRSYQQCVEYNLKTKKEYELLLSVKKKETV